MRSSRPQLPRRVTKLYRQSVVHALTDTSNICEFLDLLILGARLEGSGHPLHVILSMDKLGRYNIVLAVMYCASPQN